MKVLIACEYSGIVRDAFKGQEERAKIRSTTFTGIAAAMAQQWNFYTSPLSKQRTAQAAKRSQPAKHNCTVYF